MTARKITLVPVVANAAPDMIQSAAYIRVSSMSIIQEESFVFQKNYWTTKLQTLPNHKNVGIYSDTISGHYEKKREGFTKLIRDALAGKIDIIYTKSISRFCRNMPLLIETLRKLAEKRVAVIFEKENINSLDTKQSLILQLQGILAEQEIKNNKALVEKSRRQQFSEGRPYMCVMPFGYRQDARPEFVIDEDEARVVRMMYELYAGGMGYTKLARQLNEQGFKTRAGYPWRDSGVVKILTSEKYVGDVLMQKTFTDSEHRSQINNGDLKQWFIEGHHTGIVDRVTWDKVQAMFNARKLENPAVPRTPVPQTQPKETLASKLICSCCGKSFKRKSYTVGGSFWNCKTIRVGVCDNTGIADIVLKELALSAYNEYASGASEQSGLLEAKLQELLGERDSIATLKEGRYIDQTAYAKELARINAEFKRVDDAMRKTDGRRVLPYIAYTDEIASHIDRIETNGENLTFYFNDGQIIIRGTAKCKQPLE